MYFLCFDSSKLLKLTPSTNGYYDVGLCKNCIRKHYKVHRLVAESFIENPCNLPEVNHIDENKLNNVVSNLEWCTAQYNTSYSLSKQVFQYDLNYNLVGIWVSTAECGRNGFYGTQVANCCRGIRKTHKGYIWSYEEIKK